MRIHIIGIKKKNKTQIEEWPLPNFCENLKHPKSPRASVCMAYLGYVGTVVQA